MPEIFVTRGQTFRIAFHELLVVVHPADGAAVARETVEQSHEALRDGLSPEQAERAERHPAEPGLVQPALRSARRQVLRQEGAEARSRVRSRRVTAAGMSESHVHDVSITKEAPNYPVR